PGFPGRPSEIRSITSKWPRWKFSGLSGRTGHAKMRCSPEDTNMFRSMLLALVITLVSHAAQAQTPGRNAVTRESTITATVDRIERSSRVVTLRSPELGTFRRPG